MNYALNLRTLLPISIFFIFLVVISVSFFTSISESEKELRDQSAQYIRLNIATLARLAERTIKEDSQILEDNITQLSTNPLVKNTSVINPQGEILFASNFSWRGEIAQSSLPNFRINEFIQAKKTRKAIIEYDEENNIFVAMMSFNHPSKESALRGFEKGVIYLSYDISTALSIARYSAMIQRIPEVVTMIVLALLSIWLLRHYVVKPLDTIRLASNDIANGNFANAITVKGPIEIRQLVNTFNYMNDRLSENISELDNRAQQIQGILDNAFDGIITIDDSGMVLSFNATAEKMFKISDDEIIGKNVKKLMPDIYQSQHDQYLKNYLDSDDAKIIGIGREVEGMRVDGSVFPIDLAVTEIKLDEKRMFIGIVRDITERKDKDMEIATLMQDLANANTQLQELVRTDSLTGIANRRMFDETIGKEFNRALRNKNSLSLLLIDIDFFKNYNDHYGHVEGDQCLVKVAQVISKQFQRSGELVARYGGEEFAVILPETPLEKAHEYAKQLNEKVENQKIEHAKSTTSSYVTISIGVASVLPTLKNDYTGLIQAADAALYQAKEKGRGQAVITLISNKSGS